eukprot:gnl/MRDRNA2_/MRDRNA2_116770_c0_seq1.p1 gnl/MRDRNA2_/MRDRNA2_116770_c0~~gnl/MRDRNA2_/MRDRNA2_116770_c0_seq1.p1  ORF type:complete len:1324 (-),score=290.02 gnl/MRDRNA2_/MRDRNA2_116770_c0_seq1:17-3988(-)
MNPTRTVESPRKVKNHSGAQVTTSSASNWLPCLKGEAPLAEGYALRKQNSPRKHCVRTLPPIQHRGMEENSKSEAFLETSPQPPGYPKSKEAASHRRFLNRNHLVQRLIQHNTEKRIQMQKMIHQSYPCRGASSSGARPHSIEVVEEESVEHPRDRSLSHENKQPAAPEGSTIPHHDGGVPVQHGQPLQGQEQMKSSSSKVPCSTLYEEHDEGETAAAKQDIRGPPLNKDKKSNYPTLRVVGPLPKPGMLKEFVGGSASAALKGEDMPSKEFKYQPFKLTLVMEQSIDASSTSMEASSVLSVDQSAKAASNEDLLSTEETEAGSSLESSAESKESASNTAPQTSMTLLRVGATVDQLRDELAEAFLDRARFQQAVLEVALKRTAVSSELMTREELLNGGKAVEEFEKSDSGVQVLEEQASEKTGNPQQEHEPSENEVSGQVENEPSEKKVNKQVELESAEKTDSGQVLGSLEEINVQAQHSSDSSATASHDDPTENITALQSAADHHESMAEENKDGLRDAPDEIPSLGAVRIQAVPSEWSPWQPFHTDAIGNGSNISDDNPMIEAHEESDSTREQVIPASMEAEKSDDAPSENPSKLAVDMFSGRTLKLAAKQCRYYVSVKKAESAKQNRSSSKDLVSQDFLKLNYKNFVAFTDDEKQVVRSFFDLHDADGSASLNLPELLAVVDDIGRAPPEGSDDADQFRRIMLEVDDGNGQLSFDEFISFLEHYYASVYVRLFDQNDVDGSGTISKFEMKGLVISMKSNGFVVTDEVMVELFLNIDKGRYSNPGTVQEYGDGVMDWQEFLEFMRVFRQQEFELLRQTAGFQGTTLEYLQGIFEAGDEDRSGQLGITEVVKLLEKTMAARKIVSQEMIDDFVRLFEGMDKDKSMSLNFMEFLKLIRVWTNSNGKRGGRDDLLNLFKDVDIDSPKSPMGLQEDDDLINRVRTAAMNSGLSQKLGEDLDKMVDQLRQKAVENGVENGLIANRFNLSLEEVGRLREAFEFSDVDGSGRIDPGELSIILKTQGRAAITNLQKKAFKKTRESEEFSGDLEFHALVNFFIVFQQACVDEIEIVLSTDDGQENCFPTVKLVQAFYQMGQYMSRTSVSELLERVGGDPESAVVEKDTFLKMLELDRADKATAWRESCGFNESQLAAIRHAFGSHSCQKQNVIMARDNRIIKALELLNLAPAPEKSLQLMFAIFRTDGAGDGTITFQDFLTLVRHLENQKIYAKTQEENELARAAGLDSEALQQFRQVFNDYEPDDDGQLGFFKVQKLFADVGLITKPKQRRQLQDVLQKVKQDDNSGVTFSQFLEVLQHLETLGIFQT